MPLPPRPHVPTELAELGFVASETHWVLPLPEGFEARVYGSAQAELVLIGPGAREGWEVGTWVLNPVAKAAEACRQIGQALALSGSHATHGMKQLSASALAHLLRE